MKHNGVPSVAWKHAGCYASFALKGSAMALVLLLCLGDLAADDNPDDSLVADGTNLTVITSTRLNYDSQRKTAVFEGNVVVSNSEMNIEADRLTVVFSEDNKVSTIEAVGNVVITQEDKKGFGRKAVYYVQEGKVVLSGDPKIQRRSDELSGETITFYRGAGRIVCEPNAVLKIYATSEVKVGGLIKKE